MELLATLVMSMMVLWYNRKRYEQFWSAKGEVVKVDTKFLKMYLVNINYLGYSSIADHSEKNESFVGKVSNINAIIISNFELLDIV